MADPSDVIDTALAAGQQARRELEARGINPASRERLLRALENGVAGQLAAEQFRQAGVRVPRELSDVGLWKRYVTECRRRLEESEQDWPPEPPRRTSLRLSRELDEARAAAA